MVHPWEDEPSEPEERQPVLRRKEVVEGIIEFILVFSFFECIEPIVKTFISRVSRSVSDVQMHHIPA